MAVTQESVLTLKIKATLKDSLDLSTAEDPLNKDYSIILGNGTGANQANDTFHDQRVLAASANEDLDLAGVLANAFGDTLTFTKIKAIVIKAASGNTNNVRVTRPAVNGFTLFLAASDGLDIVPDGVFIFVAPSSAGIAVTAGTGDLLNIANSGAGSSVTYDVIIIGAR